jgi:hypothetical protein
LRSATTTLLKYVNQILVRVILWQYTYYLLVRVIL